MEFEEQGAEVFPTVANAGLSEETVCNTENLCVNRLCQSFGAFGREIAREVASVSPCNTLRPWAELLAPDGASSRGRAGGDRRWKLFPLPVDWSKFKFPPHQIQGDRRA